VSSVSQASARPLAARRASSRSGDGGFGTFIALSSLLDEEEGKKVLAASRKNAEGKCFAKSFFPRPRRTGPMNSEKGFKEITMGINPNHNQTVVRPELGIRIANHNQTVVR
jgi:hypothetical protein